MELVIENDERPHRNNSYIRSVIGIAFASMQFLNCLQTNYHVDHVKIKFLKISYLETKYEISSDS